MAQKQCRKMAGAGAMKATRIVTARPTAIRIVCDVAGVAGALIPARLYDLASSNGLLAELLREAEEWVDKTDYLSSGYVHELGLRTFNRHPDPERLTWETSVITEIARVDGGYQVTVYGTQSDPENPSRHEALRASAEKHCVGRDVVELDTQCPERAYFPAYKATMRSRELCALIDARYP